MEISQALATSYEVPMFSSFRLLFTFVALSCLAHAAAGGKTPSVPDQVLLQRAKQIHHKIVTFDSHVDVPVGLDPASDGKSQFDLVKVERGHLSGAALAVFVGQAKRTPENYQKAHAEADAKYQTILDVAQKNPSRAALAYSPADVRSLAKHGKFAVVISFLDAFPLGKDLSQIDTWYHGGVRIFGFNHAGNNDWANSSRPVWAFGDE
jgi:membrane dipeptidase